MEPAAPFGAGLSERESITPARSKSSPYLARAGLSKHRAPRREMAAEALRAVRAARGEARAALPSFPRSRARAFEPARRVACAHRPTANVPTSAIRGSHLVLSTPSRGGPRRAHALLTHDSKRRCAPARVRVPLLRSAVFRIELLQHGAAKNQLSRKQVAGAKAHKAQSTSGCGRRRNLAASPRSATGGLFFGRAQRALASSRASA
jgi:hypothetical protein